MYRTAVVFVIINLKTKFSSKFVAIIIIYLHTEYLTANSNDLFPSDWKLNMQFLQTPCSFTFCIKTVLKNCTYFWNICCLANAQIYRHRDKQTERLNAVIYALIKYGMHDKNAWLDGFMPLILHIGLPYILVSTKLLSFSYHRSISFFIQNFLQKVFL